MSESSHNRDQSPEAESAVELLHSASALAADVLLRSGIPLDANWSKISFDHLLRNDERITDHEELELHSSYGYAISYTRTVRDNERRDIVGQSRASVSIDPDGGLGMRIGNVSISELTDKLESHQGQAAKVEFNVPAAD